MAASTVPSSKVQLNISCADLPSLDTFSKSDPMCVLYTRDPKQSSWDEVGRTEMIKNSENPHFTKSFEVVYYFEELQELLFRVYDVDSPKANLSKQDFVGELTCHLGEIVGSPGQKLSRPLANSAAGGRKNGSITVSAEEMTDMKAAVKLQFRGSKLDKKDLFGFGKSDPYLELSRANPDGSYTVVHRTEYVNNDCNPHWLVFQIPISTLCNGDPSRAIRFACYDYDNDGSHDLIGVFTTNLRDLDTPAAASSGFPLINEKKAKRKSRYQNSGVIFCTTCTTFIQPSFLDYIAGGCELAFTVAVDFTGSNGDPRSASSLHYQNPYQPNEYLQALYAVGNIIADYDSDKKFPALGFGAKLPNGAVSHEFALNGNPQNPFCDGIAGIVQAYQQAVHNVTFWGPTNFAPIINHVSKLAAQSVASTPKCYHILLILTDGVISDMELTKQAIIKASKLPVSVIIVGVGAADFSAMEILDGDNSALRSGHLVAERDIVQFVPFREYKKLSSARLAKDVLAEIPEQLVGYFAKKHIQPSPKPSA